MHTKDSIISERKLSKQIRLPEFLISVEEYNIIQEPPMKNFQWMETTNNFINLERGAILTDNFISRRSRQNKRIQLCCSPLNIFLFVWLLIVVGTAGWLIADIINGETE